MQSGRGNKINDNLVVKNGILEFLRSHIESMGIFFVYVHTNSHLS